ncbi:hypothetical protein DL98DRAFT_596688 [Cadophora sp. DSE1049]|nr:hypothetical protein DL98DRAFT_596688 [Cadophora sp. DSE1049]
MDSVSQRMTCFPGASTDVKVPEENLNTNRHTRFPGGTELQKFSVLNDHQSIIESTEHKTTHTPSRLPLRINPPDATPAKPRPTTTITAARREQPPIIRAESPWKSYLSLRTLERGGEVTAACRREVPVEMVAVKKLSVGYIKGFPKCQHENLLAILEVYRFEGTFWVITDYTAATLKQIIAIPLPLEELHISATCRMQYLSRFGLAHKNLDSSKILFSSNGCAKIAHFDECQSSESASARPLGVITVEMMQNGIPPEMDVKIVLKHPERWSPEVSNFLEVVSWSTLKDIQKNNFLKYVSPTVMIPFVEYARWDTIESLSLQCET